MPPTIPPPTAPGVDDAVAAPGDHRCGRCRRVFPADPDGLGAAAGDWWVCPPCREAILPGRTARAGR